MKIFFKIVRVVVAFIIAAAVSGIFSVFMLAAAGETADRNERIDNVQYTCADADNYANCYRGETGRSLISLSGGMSADTHVVIGSILAVFIFAAIFVAIGFPKLRKKILSTFDYINAT